MNSKILINELEFKAIRSSGAGGQHVNKVSSKIELTFDIENSNGLSSDEKQLLFLKLKSKLTTNKVLKLQCDKNRSQHKNKAIIIERFLEIISKGLKVSKKRKKTKPSKSSIEKRLNSKKKQALKKINRNKPSLN